MPMTVQHDRDRDQLHLILRDDRIIIDREWCAPNAAICLAADGEAIAITVYNYYTDKKWLFTPEFVEKYHLEGNLDDLRLVYEAFFAPQQMGVKYVSYEGPDGEEVIVPAGGSSGA